MAETTLEQLRAQYPEWPEPVNFRDRFLEPHRLTMDTILSRESNYINIGDRDAPNDNSNVLQGDWYKMIRWTIGHHRGAAASPMVQNEVIMAHAAHGGDTGQGASDVLWPGMVMSHFGALGAAGSQPCNDGHTKLTEYAMKYFVDNECVRAPITWSRLHSLMTYIKEQAGGVSNANEGMPWIDAMLRWMEVAPLWARCISGQLYRVAYQLPISLMGEASRVQSDWIGANHYDPMAWRERCIRPGMLVRVESIDTYAVKCVIVGGATEYSRQFACDTSPPTGELRFHMPSLALRADGDINAELPVRSWRQFTGTDGVTRRLPYRNAFSWEVTSPTSGRKGYIGTILRQLTESEAAAAKAVVDQWKTLFDGLVADPSVDMTVNHDVPEASEAA